MSSGTRSSDRHDLRETLETVPRFPRPRKTSEQSRPEQSRPERRPPEWRAAIHRFLRTTLTIGFVILFGVGAVAIYQFTQSPVVPDSAPRIYLNLPPLPIYAGETKLGVGPIEIALDGVQPGTFRVPYDHGWDGLLQLAFPGCEHVAVSGPGEHFEGIANGRPYEIDISGFLIGYIDGDLESVLFVRFHWTEETLMSCGFFRFPRNPARTFDPKSRVQRSQIRSFLDRCLARASLDPIEITPQFHAQDQIPRRWQSRHPRVGWRLNAEPNSTPHSR